MSDSTATPKEIDPRVEKFLETIASKANIKNLQRTISPEVGVSAYEYLVAMAAQPGVKISALYAGLTNANTRNRVDRLDNALAAFGEAKEGEPLEVASARKVLEAEKASLEWIREADKAIAALRARKANVNLSRSVKHWAWVLDVSVPQAPVMTAVDLLEAYESTEFWARKANAALTALFAFKPICGCGCNSELTRKTTPEGKPGKYHKQCYKSFIAANPKQDKDEELKAAAKQWGVNYVPAKEAKPDEYMPKPMRATRARVKPVKPADDPKPVAQRRNRKSANADAIAQSIAEGE